jgi:hypothetical protein
MKGKLPLSSYNWVKISLTCRVLKNYNLYPKSKENSKFKKIPKYPCLYYIKNQPKQ